METPEQYTVKTPLTLQEAKDKAAQNHEFNSWDSLCKMLKYNGVYEANIGIFHDEAAEIYSSELIKENERLSGDFLVQGASLIRVKAENERLKGTIGVECVKQLLAARQENKELLEALRALFSYQSPATDDPNSTFKYSQEWVKVYNHTKELLSKFQPKKDESHDATIEAR